MIEFDAGAVVRSERLVVAFTGVRHALGGVAFDFHKSLAGQAAAALFVKDVDLAWYQNAGDADLILERMAWAKQVSGARHVACLGSSMGGFGALYFAARFRADACLAFAPQTAIDPNVTRALGDARWSAFQERITSYPFGDLAHVPPGPARISVCYGSDETLDTTHVDHLAARWTLHRLPVAAAGHSVAHVLKHQSRLQEVIEASFAL